MIYKQMNKTPMMQNINDEFLSVTTKDGVQPENVPSRIHAISYSLKIAPIMEEMQALHIKYRLKDDDSSLQSGREPIGPDPTSILRIDSRLDDYLDQIPEHLRTGVDLNLFNINEEDKEIFKLQGQVARSRCVLSPYY